MHGTTGLLILHGFTATRATVAPLIPVAESLGMAWELPQLRGHWTVPDDLHGVTYQDLLGDALAAYDRLRATVERVAIVGLSVGGMLALDIAARRADIAALVALAPALRYVSPLVRIAPLVALLQKEVTGGDRFSGYSEPSYATGIENYERFPTATFYSLLKAIPGVVAHLPTITAPALVIGARRDRVVQPSAAQLAYDRVGSKHKQLIWLERSGHELLIDCEGPYVCEQVRHFLRPR